MSDREEWFHKVFFLTVFAVGVERKEHEEEKDKKKHGNRNNYKKEAKEETLNK